MAGPALVAATVSKPSAHWEVDHTCCPAHVACARLKLRSSWAVHNRAPLAWQRFAASANVAIEQEFEPNLVVAQ